MSQSKFASQTSVSAHKSRDEIERCLMRYGATGFVYGYQDTRALIEFIYNNKKIRFVLTLPDRASKEFRRSPSGRKAYNDAQAFAAWEQATRQRWRALALVIKAKLEAVASGITVFEQEFLANIVMPNGRTVAEEVIPVIEQAYLTGGSPRLLTTGL